MLFVVRSAQLAGAYFAEPSFIPGEILINGTCVRDPCPPHFPLFFCKREQLGLYY